MACAHGLTHRDLAADSGVVFAVRSMQVDFLAPARIDDLLCVETGAATARGASIEFHQRVVLGEKALVAAIVLVVAIRDGRPARLPAALRQALGEAAL